MFSDTRETTVVSQPRRFSTSVGVGPVEADPGLLDGVVRLAERTEHAVGHGAQVGPVLLEALGLAAQIVHVCPVLPRRLSVQQTRRAGKM